MGGAEVYTALIANMHAKKGNPSHVIFRVGPGPISSRFISEVNVSYLNFTRDSIRKPISFIKSLILGYSLLTKQISNNKIDVLHTHLPAENLWGLIMALTGKCKVVITIHNNNFLNSPDGTKFGNVITRVAYKMMLTHCAAIVVVSNEVQQSYIKLLNVKDTKNKIHVINNGVLIPKPISIKQQNEIRTQNGILPTDFWIIAAGRLTEAKNFSCLIQAISELKAKGISTKVTIAGEGPLRSKLNNEIQALDLNKEITLSGNFNNLSEIMLSADLLAMPSLWEGLPLTLLEAMASSLPVVGTLINGLSDIITDGKQGYLVTVNDHMAFAKGIEKQIMNPEFRREMGQQGMALVHEKYSFDRVYNQLKKVYSIADGKS